MYFGQTWLDFHLFRLILSRVVLCLKEEIFEVNKHIMIFHNVTTPVSSDIQLLHSLTCSRSRAAVQLLRADSR